MCEGHITAQYADVTDESPVGWVESKDQYFPFLFTEMKTLVKLKVCQMYVRMIMKRWEQN